MGASFMRDLGFLAPEMVLTAGIIVLLVADLFSTRPQGARAGVTALALGVLFTTAWVALASDAHPATEVFFGQLAIDPLGGFFKLLFVCIAIVTVLTSALSAELPRRQMGEYYALLIAVTLGMFLMASANDLLMVYLSVELVSIVSYAMVGYRLHDRRSSEAALKYVIYGGAASGLMLFGISLFYGLLGTTELSGLHHAVTAALTDQEFAAGSGLLGAFPLALVTGFVLIFAGLGFKISAVPFHMWAPDVYEGAPTPFTGFLSVGPKAAGFALLMRVVIDTFVPPPAVAGAPGFATDILGMMHIQIDLPVAAFFGIVAALTMTVGNFAAIPQNNVKRLLAFSSIAHAGYLLMGFVVFSEAALHAVVLYLVFYFLMNVGAFTVCQIVRDRAGGETLEHFTGLGTKAPWIAICMTFFLFSLTGIPPMAGFIGKFYLFAAVIDRGGFWYVLLAVIAVANSVVSLYYYMRIVRAMFLTSPADDRAIHPGLGYTAVATALALPTLVLCFYWSPVSETIRSAISIYRAPATDTQALGGTAAGTKADGVSAARAMPPAAEMIVPPGPATTPAESL